MLVGAHSDLVEGAGYQTHCIPLRNTSIDPEWMNDYD